MRPRWWWIAGPAPRDGERPRPSERQAADTALDALLDAWYVVGARSPRPPEPIARCAEPVEECLALGYAVESSGRRICARWPRCEHDVPRGALPVATGEAVLCDRMRIEPPRRGGGQKAKASRPSPSAPGVRSRDRIARWLDEALKAIASGDGDAAAGARAYLAGDEPEGEAKPAVIAAIRRRARETGPPREEKAALAECAVLAERVFGRRPA